MNQGLLLMQLTKEVLLVPHLFQEMLLVKLLLKLLRGLTLKLLFQQHLLMDVLEIRSKLLVWMYNMFW